MKRKMTGSKKAATADLTEISGDPGNRPRITERGRIRIDVTNGGIASETQRIEEKISNDKHRLDGRDRGVKMGIIDEMRTAEIRIRGDRLRPRI